jgi:hypothetical protein
MALTAGRKTTSLLVVPLIAAPDRPFSGSMNPLPLAEGGWGVAPRAWALGLKLLLRWWCSQSHSRPAVLGIDKFHPYNFKCSARA